MRNANDTPLSA